MPARLPTPGDSQGVAEFRVKRGACSLSPQVAEVLVPNVDAQLGPSNLTGEVDPSWMCLDVPVLQFTYNGPHNVRGTRQMHILASHLFVSFIRLHVCQ